MKESYEAKIASQEVATPTPEVPKVTMTKKEESIAKKKEAKFQEITQPNSTGKKKAKVIRYTGNTDENSEIKERKPKRPREEKKEGDASDEFESSEEEQEIDSDELPDEYFELDETEKKAYKEQRERIRKEREENFKKRKQIEQQLAESSLKTFRDRPEEIKEIRCVHAQGDMLVIEWDAPGDNNCPIKGYTVYLSSKRVKINHLELDNLPA